MSYLQEVMKELMDWIYAYTNNYGIAIILLTVLIKIILMPFNYMQINSVKKLQEIAPEQKKIQEKYKNNPDKMNEELMKLYRENKINPMGGCLPLLIQFPFIIALFRVFQTYDFSGASFLWIKDLSLPDTTYILPVLAAATTYLQNKLSTPASADSANASMNIIMPLMIGWFALKFASGLAMYWVVSNLVQIVQLLLTRPRALAKEDVK